MTSLDHTHGTPKKASPRRSKALDYTILEAMDDPALFGRWFKGDSWDPWRIFLAALFGLPMSPTQLEFYRECTGRSQPPETASTEAWVIAGRRAGKSAVLAFIATYLACFKSYSQHLQIGERATIRIMSADRDQSRVIFRYLSAFLSETPLLSKLVAKQTAETIELTNRVTIEIGTASFRSSRGYSFAAILIDEIAFIRSDESANPDTEIIAAARPGMATIPNSMMLCASSPYARKGELWKSFDKWFGKDGAPLIWKASTLAMNRTVPRTFVEAETLKDPTSAAAEYGAEFRSDIEAFISMDVLRSCIQAGIYERAPELRWRYYAFVDPSGGSGDSFTLALAHREGNTCILDLVREIRSPLSPEQVTEEYAAIVKQYRCTKVVGDRYAGEWPRERFRACGINYEVSDNTKSEIYQQLLPIINSNGAILLDHDRMVYQFCSLERRTARSGRDSIDHPPKMRDDLSNAAAGAIVLAHERPATWRPKTRLTFPGEGSPPVSSGSGFGSGLGWMGQ